MYKNFKHFFLKPRKIFLTFLIFIVLFFIFSVLPNYKIVLNFLSLENISIFRKIELLFQYSFVYLFETSIFSFTLTLFTCLFLSLNIILFYHFYKKQEKMLKNKGFLASITGIFLSLFGVGCLSCGALFIAPFLSFFGVVSVLDFLPFGGNGVAALGLILTFFSFFYLLYQISKPKICK
ncbi:hypothetical protein CSB11_01365 [Candidatus Campbellbacteria bacterium]|nr:MAG: hypothetical protein CSB11_01365 [Candidatus Campbellbacteria bacterium]